jgi:outer membrane protein assembly factor BamA
MTYFYPGLYNYEPGRWAALDPSAALATQTVSGASASALYPLSRFVRAEGRLGYFHYEGEYDGPPGFAAPAAKPSSYLMNGDSLSASAAVTGETTRFEAFGPASGATFRVALDWALPVSEKFLRHLSVEADLRQYVDLGSDVLAAFRFRGFASFGRDPFLRSYGGNNQVRSACFSGIQGTRYWYANAEIRFPLVHSASTIAGASGPLRGVLFFDVTQRRIRDDPDIFYPLSSAASSAATSESRLAAIGSYGAGVELFVFGLPLHVEFARRLEWPSPSRPFKFSASGDYVARFWAGFDF